MGKTDTAIILPDVTRTSTQQQVGGPSPAVETGGPSQPPAKQELSELTIILPRGIKVILEFWDTEGRSPVVDNQAPMYVDFSSQILDTRGRKTRDAIC